MFEHGGFAQAAAALHMTQPAISMAIRKLEDELGHTLLERQAKPIALTDFGRAAYRSWETHAAELKRLARELHGMADLNTACVSLVLGATFPLRAVVAAFESLRGRYPGFRLQVEMGGYTSHVAKVADGSVDMILSQLPASGPDPRFTYEPLISDRFKAVCHRSHALADKANIAWSDLAKHPWASGGPFDAFLPGWSDMFHRHEVPVPEPFLITNSTVATMAAVVGHGYLAMLPTGCFAEELTSGFLRTLPLRELEWPQAKGASWLSTRALAPGASAYLEELRLHLSQRTCMDAR